MIWLEFAISPPSQPPPAGGRGLNGYEEIMEPQLREFCSQRGLYLDTKGIRGSAREGKKVTWQDKFGNYHDLDFVIEKDGTDSQRGRPLAFIEAAWRRYTKHSRNKAQEIQGAILPIAEKYAWDKPFLGAILAGVFTEDSLTQMRSSGFKVVLFPYESIVDSFAVVDVNIAFEEDTPDEDFERTIEKIECLESAQRTKLTTQLLSRNQEILTRFFGELEAALDRRIAHIVVIPLHGGHNEFPGIQDAFFFVQDYDETKAEDGVFREYKILVRFSNGDNIEAAFKDKANTLDFLRYVSGEKRL